MLWLPVQAFQQPGIATNEKELQRQRERAQAVSMVEQTAAEAPLWDDKRSAVQVLADAADLLWDKAPAQGAKWLTKAWELIDQVSDAPKDKHLKEFSSRSEQNDLRTAVLSIARKHQPELAEKFLKQLSETAPSEKKERGAFDDRTARSEQLLQMARQTADSSPELAFTLAERSLADGISYSLQTVLTSLRKKNVALANQLFDLALVRFSSAEPDPSEAEVLAGYLFQPGLTFSSNNAGNVIMTMNPMQRNDPVVAETEPQRARAFLVAAYQSFFARPIPTETQEGKLRGQRIWVFGTRNLGRYNTLAPEFVGPTRDFLMRLQIQIYPEGRGDPFSGGRQSGNDMTTKPRTEKEIYEARISDMEERADKEVDQNKKTLAYVNAALAVNATDYQRAKRIAEKIADEALRSDVIAYVVYRAALSLVRQKETDKAVELAAQLNDVPRRAVVKIAIAQSLLTSKTDDRRDSAELTVNQQQAFDLLSAVERDISKEAPSINAAKILLGRATLLATLDKDQALLALEQTVEVINKLETYRLRDASPPQLGLSVSPRSEALADTPRLGFTFRNAIEPLIRVDFENLADLSGRFKAKEVRGVGRLEVAKLYLQANQ